MIPHGLSNEMALRTQRIADQLKSQGTDAILVSENANLYYTSGRVFCGFTYITADGDVTYFVRRPVGLTGDNVRYIRKPEQIAELLPQMPQSIALELDSAPFSTVERLRKVFGDARVANGSDILRRCRAVKTPYEIARLTESGVHHAMAYSRIPRIYRGGMTDVELQVEIERVLRNEGCLGQFRIAGGSMELFMGNLLTGENADAPSPYDFAMGGAGLDLSLPVGCNGSAINPGQTVMVDMCGNFTGYMTDMTRVYYVGRLDPTAAKAHQLSIDIHHRLAQEFHAGCEAKRMWEVAMEIVAEAGMDDYFMGHAQKAGFVGHGVGIEVNELPVLAPRSRDVLEDGNVIAIEPKFVIPHVGAVGIENTYVVRPDRLECITNAPEPLTELLYY
ncbi:MAG: Xaa-Pro peptidase family protein [Bacteroidales bacterium]|nr:Xaa-Pro peptidase family protein [Bacteroidales bacterium]